MACHPVGAKVFILFHDQNSTLIADWIDVNKVFLNSRINQI